MRIRRLDFRAFGPFAGRALDFGSELPGLHVVHGPNEAGKSSAMRGLQALLFGFPPRTGDNFLHPYDQLLVGGCLQGQDGSQLEFLRRKKAKNDLFDAFDNPMSPETLAPYLQGLGLDLFSSMYGIDHETLVRGGQGILDQQGEVGQALFAAGAGFASLRGVLDGLDAEGDELFRPRASSKALSQALAHHKELQGQLRAASLGSQEWQKHCRALTQAEEELDSLARRRGEIEREIHQLERLGRALPYLGQRRLYLEKLQELGEVSPLPNDFGARRRQLEERRRAAKVRLEGVESRLADLGARRAALRFNQAILAHDGHIEGVHQRLGAYLKALEDRPGLEGLRVGIKIEAARLLRRIRPDLEPDQAESLRPGLARRRTVQALAQRHDAVLQGVRQAEGRLRELDRDLESRRVELAATARAVEDGSLDQALRQVRKAGDMDEEVRARQAELERAGQEWRASLLRLGLWSGSAPEAVGLRLPLAETVNGFETALHEQDEEIRRQTREAEKAGQLLADLARERSAIEHASVVPSEAELAVCRARRDEGWGLLRRQWIEGADVTAEAGNFDADLPLPEAYEQSVAVADGTADRMYREADRVQKYAQLLASIEAAEAARGEAGSRMDEARQARGELDVRWNGLWADCGISPLGPREMRAWMANFEAVRLQAAALGRMEVELASRRVRQGELRELLERELAQAGDAAPVAGVGLSPVLRRAEALSESLRDARARREGLERSVRELQAEADKTAGVLLTARQDLEEWRTAWREVMGFLGLAATATPEEAADYVDTVQECLAKLDEAETVRKRRDGIDRDARDFESRVRELLAEVDPAAAVDDAALGVGRLKGMLAQAQRDQAVHARLGEDAESLQREAVGLREELGLLDVELEELRTLARCTDDEGMTRAEERFAEWTALRSGRDEAEAALARLAEGGTLHDLQALAEREDPDALPGRAAALREELEERLNPRIRQLAEVVGREKNELARMDGGDAAARIGEEMQDVLARISRMTERFIRLRVASAVLRAEIERYRAANQDPLLAVASDLFRDLTLGSFSGLRADMDENDRPVLVGLRPAGGWVRVEGMSSGTRDQLYLSLRLASLRRRAETAEPMPFIVDDILINFDEFRAEATLRALADMADRTQIIMFTHQGLIADLAQGLGREDRVMVHRL